MGNVVLVDPAIPLVNLEMRVADLLEMAFAAGPGCPMTKCATVQCIRGSLWNDLQRALYPWKLTA